MFAAIIPLWILSNILKLNSWH